MSDQQRHPHLDFEALRKRRKVLLFTQDGVHVFTATEWDGGLLPGAEERAFERLEIGGEG